MRDPSRCTRFQELSSCLLDVAPVSTRARCPFSRSDLCPQTPRGHWRRPRTVRCNQQPSRPLYQFAVCGKTRAVGASPRQSRSTEGAGRQLADEHRSYPWGTGARNSATASGRNVLSGMPLPRKPLCAITDYGSFTHVRSFLPRSSLRTTQVRRSPGACRVVTYCLAIPVSRHHLIGPETNNVVSGPSIQAAIWVNHAAMGPS